MNFQRLFVLICACAVSAPLAICPMQAQSLLEQTLMQLDREWAKAAFSGDAATVERIEASGFVVTAPDGSLSDKMGSLNDVKSNSLKADAVDLDDLKVHVYGSAAVVTGKIIIKNGSYHGQNISGGYRFTDVFANLSGEWRAIASQLNRAN